MSDVLPLKLLRSLEHLTLSHVARALHSSAWFVLSFVGSAFVIFLFSSGSGVFIVATIGESIASLLPGTLLTPIWAALVYLVIGIALPPRDLRRSSATAAITGSLSFLFLVFGYYRYLVPYLATLSNTSEFKQDTWFRFYAALIVCIITAVAIEYAIIKISTPRQTGVVDDSAE